MTLLDELIYAADEDGMAYALRDLALMHSIHVK